MAYSRRDIIYRHERRFVITPFSEEERHATPAGYDLKVGALVIVDYDSKKNTYSRLEDKIQAPLEAGNLTVQDATVPPKSHFIVCSYEKIKNSNRVLQTVHARASLSSKGIMVNPLTIDPNFEGHIILLMYNSSPRPVKISSTDKIATMIFHGTEFETKAEPNTTADGLLHKYEIEFSRETVAPINSFITSWYDSHWNVVHREATKKMKKFRDKSRLRRRLQIAFDRITDAKKDDRNEWLRKTAFFDFLAAAALIGLIIGIVRPEWDLWYAKYDSEWSPIYVLLISAWFYYVAKRLKF